MAPATQGSSAYLCLETDSHSNKHVFLDGGVVKFDYLPNCDLPPFITKGKQYFLVHAKYGPRAHRKFQRFWVSELKGGAPLALQACSTKFKTRIFPSDWVDNEIDKLIKVITDNGKSGTDGKVSITFGQLFILYQDISYSLVGIMMRAKKRSRLRYALGVIAKTLCQQAEIWVA